VWTNGLITDQSMLCLSNYHLTELVLSHINITDAGLIHIGRISTLITLGIPSCAGISDDGIEHLVDLKKLKSLDLTACPLITDGVIRHLAKLPLQKNRYPLLPFDYVHCRYDALEDYPNYCAMNFKK
jgi:hypothetical protein